MTGKCVLKGIPGNPESHKRTPKLNSERNPESQKESLNDPKTRSVGNPESLQRESRIPKTHFSRESRIPPEGIPNPENSILRGIPNPTQSEPQIPSIPLFVIPEPSIRAQNLAFVGSNANVRLRLEC